MLAVGGSVSSIVWTINRPATPPTVTTVSLVVSGRLGAVVRRVRLCPGSIWPASAVKLPSPSLYSPLAMLIVAGAVMPVSVMVLLSSSSPGVTPSWGAKLKLLGVVMGSGSVLPPGSSGSLSSPGVDGPGGGWCGSGWGSLPLLPPQAVNNAHSVRMSIQTENLDCGMSSYTPLFDP